MPVNQLDQDLWNSLRHANILMTGGTGFFGHWLLESFLRANAVLKLEANMMVLTRNVAAFLKKSPQFNHQQCLSFIEGDVKNFAFPQTQFTHVIHAATDASAHLNETNPLLMLDTIIEGTRRTLECARQTQAKQFLLVSSGAVYGRQPPTLSHIDETYSCQPNIYDHRSAYAVGKCTAEHFGFLYAKQFGLEVKIARCFAFVGPYLPLDTHFAIGNFIRDAMRGGPIIVNGDGSPYRSYLYAADLAIWLWTILLNGRSCVPYNVGSETAYNIRDLAHLVAASMPFKVDVQILKESDPTQLGERYVPSTQRARSELGLKENFSLSQSIKATYDWYSQREKIPTI